MLPLLLTCLLAGPGPLQASRAPADDPRLIHAGNARFLAGAEPALPDELRVDAGPDGTVPAGWFLVQFDRPPTPADRERLDALSGPVRGRDGAPLARWYVPGRSLAAWVADAQALAALRALPGVAAVVRFQPGYKLAPELDALRRADGDALLRLDVELMPGHPVEDVRARLAAAGAELADEIHVENGTLYEVAFLVVVARADRLDDVARVEGVRYVLRSGRELQLHDLSAASKLQGAALGADDGSASPVVVAQHYPLWVDRDLQGQGQLIGVVDTHLDWNNVPAPDSVCAGAGYPSDAIDSWGFADPVAPRVPAPTSGPSPKVPLVLLLSGAALSSAGPSGPDQAHGTHVAGAAAADFFGERADLWWEHDPDQWLNPAIDTVGLLGPGIAHEAQLYFAPVLAADDTFAWTFGFPQNLAAALTAMAQADVCASVHSTGVVESPNTYTAVSVVHDTQVYARPWMLPCAAAGNNGSQADALVSQAVPKNVLTVGGSDDVLRPQDRYALSSIGPRFDGALKPDLLAPACDTAPRNAAPFGSRLVLPHANGAASTAPCDYARTCGTSMAAPIAAGAAALVHQYFERGDYDGLIPLTDPTAALMKAVLIHSGRRLTGAHLGPGGPYPSVWQGWGEPDLTRVLAWPGTPHDLIAYDLPGGAAPPPSGGTGGLPVPGALAPFAKVGERPWIFRFAVTGSDEPLAITLVWTDEPGSAGPGKKLINDLDLLVRPPAGTPWIGNVFDTAAGVSVTGGTRDSLNNVERVVLAAPAAGDWRVRVAPVEGNYAAPQGFALVVTGEVVEAEPLRPAQVGLGSTPGFTPPLGATPVPGGGTLTTVVGAFTLTVSADEDVACDALRLTIEDLDLAAMGPFDLWLDADADGALDPGSIPLERGLLQGPPEAPTVLFAPAGGLVTLAAGSGTSFLITAGDELEAADGGTGAGALGAPSAWPRPPGPLVLAAAALLALLAVRARPRPRPVAALGLGLLAACALGAGACGGSGGAPAPPPAALSIAGQDIDCTGVDSLEPIVPELEFGELLGFPLPAS